MKIALVPLLFLSFACGNTSKAPAPTASASEVVPTLEPSADPQPSASEAVTPAAPVEHALAEYTTRFKAGTSVTDGRVENITLVAARIKDFVLAPGEEFSFNKTVGPRSQENGFKNAPTYFAGEVLEGIGGGTCQVSSTLYAAALHAGTDILERRPHSRKSSYVEVGLDATVNYPASCEKADDPTVCYDLRFKNPYPFPLHIITEVGSELGSDGKRSLKVTVFGTGEGPKVTTTWSAWSTPAFEVRRRRVPFWKDDRTRLKQPGQPGLEGARTVVLAYPDGHEVRRKVVSRYQPVPEVWEVGQEWKEP